jgi:hypothetical protein
MWPRWLRAVLGGWVIFDSRKRGGISIFWAALVIILGPLLIPLYLTCRPLLEGERKRGTFFTNLFWNFEPLVSGLTTLAAVAVSIENFLESGRRELAPVKRAEIKAGTI